MTRLCRKPKCVSARWRAVASGLLMSMAPALVATPALAANAPDAKAAAAADRASRDRAALRAQLGIIYAQNGQRAQAREEFVKLMEEPQGRSAALTNLGNLDFLEGKVEPALESYRQAGALDGKDAGILLNQGLALKLLGQTEEAERVFGLAVEMAGGVEQASYLLGINGVEDAGRGKVSKMSTDEVRQMLIKAKAGVPAANATTKSNGTQAKVTSRPGGARAADVSVGVQNLYWKDR